MQMYLELYVRSIVYYLDQGDVSCLQYEKTVTKPAPTQLCW